MIRLSTASVLILPLEIIFGVLQLVSANSRNTQVFAAPTSMRPHKMEYDSSDGLPTRCFDASRLAVPVVDDRAGCFEVFSVRPNKMGYDSSDASFPSRSDGLGLSMSAVRAGYCQVHWHSHNHDGNSDSFAAHPEKRERVLHTLLDSQPIIRARRVVSPVHKLTDEMDEKTLHNITARGGELNHEVIQMELLRMGQPEDSEDWNQAISEFCEDHFAPMHQLLLDARRLRGVYPAGRERIDDIVDTFRKVNEECKQLKSTREGTTLYEHKDIIPT
ncbi:hypothetical protein FB446DRAFT_316165 [Lentinula raphanica]|nr:hypothetical protein FB446DRAFT_316165 [Lentinula raphanica]